MQHENDHDRQKVLVCLNATKKTSELKEKCKKAEIFNKENHDEKEMLLKYQRFHQHCQTTHQTDRMRR